MIYRIFGIIPNNIELYKLALIHRSASIILEQGGVINNERLEFLGDAVIETVVSELLFIEYPELNEGGLTQLRSRIVSRMTLNQLAIDLGLANEIIANPSSVSVHKHNIFGDAFEALIGAIYLDCGYDKTNRTLIKIINLNLDIENMTQTERDFKSRIIEWCQKNRRTVCFESQISGNHTELTPNFETILLVDGQASGFGAGRSKKEAEQRAAKQFYDTIIESNAD